MTFLHSELNLIESRAVELASRFLKNLHGTTMKKQRMEAFSDGVIAILITIMVLELKVPHDTSLTALIGLYPVFLSYVLSFIYIGIYWNNHHHLLQAIDKVNGRVLWANLHFLFWLSLIPFASGWMGENDFAQLTVTVYGAVLLLTAIAYFFLEQALVKHHGSRSILSAAVGAKTKEKMSMGLYLVGLIASIWLPWVGLGAYVLVALMWLVPDSRVEALVQENGKSHGSDL